MRGSSLCVRRWLPCALIGLALGCSLLEAQGAPTTPVRLPQPLGAVSDYGARLGRKTREELQARISELEEKAGVSVYVLITLLDPFDNPSTLAEEIWKAWKLEEKAEAVLLLFAREGEPWAFRWRAHPALNPKLRSPEMRATWAEVEALVERRRIAEAVRTGVEGLHRLLLSPPPRAAPQSGMQGGKTGKAVGLPAWAYALGGVLGVLLLLTGAAAYALVWLCPECGSRLARSPLPYGYGMRSYRRARGVRRAWVYYCRRCGYRRASGGERGRGPRRPYGL